MVSVLHGPAAPYYLMVGLTLAEVLAAGWNQS